jgi:cell division protein FtsB
MSRKSQTADLIALIENLKDEIHSLKEQIKTLEEERLLPNKNQKKNKNITRNTN